MIAIRDFAFLNIYNRDEAIAAVNSLNNTRFRSNEILVEQARSATGRFGDPQSGRDVMRGTRRFPRQQGRFAGGPRNGQQQLDEDDGGEDFYLQGNGAYVANLETNVHQEVDHHSDPSERIGKIWIFLSSDCRYLHVCNNFRQCSRENYNGSQWAGYD